ncbi:MAG: acyl-ACP--UDP-N-acetylglucosamine O-acyltransferase [Planctomycetota bacterium]|nr:MAG: acyl-ACP--UDP-N-acetylglucosamine O-acyltransferase [Planctomycetota bacterium]
MAKIHPTAIVDPQAELGPDVEVGPYAIIEGGAVIGEGTKIYAHAYISRYTRLGCHCLVHVGAVLGTDPQSINFDPNLDTYVEIGDNNVIREYVTIHRSTDPEIPTKVGNHNFIMAQSHIAHDVQVCDHVTIANNAMIAGHVTIGSHSFISGGVPIHQFVRIGEYCFLSGWCAVSMDVPPFMISQGPNTIKAVNVVALKRANFSPEEIEEIRKAFKCLYRSNSTLKEALEELEKMESPHGHIKTLIEFIRDSKRGICKYAKNSAAIQM